MNGGVNPGLQTDPTTDRKQDKPDQPERRIVRTKHVDARQLALFKGRDALRYYVDEDSRGWN